MLGTYWLVGLSLGEYWRHVRTVSDYGLVHAAASRQFPRGPDIGLESAFPELPCGTAGVQAP